MTTKTMYLKKVISTSGRVQYYETPNNPTPDKIPHYANKKEGRAVNLARTNNLENQILMDNKYKNVMALNLNQTNNQLSVKQMVDEILELYPELREKIIISGTGLNNYKRIGRMCCFLMSLFVGWKSGVVVRYGRRTSWHTAIKTPLKKDGELSIKFGFSLKKFSEQYEIIALNELVDIMNALGLLNIKMGFIIPETQERYQTRLHITDDLKNIFKKYEDQIDMNLVRYLNDVEFITAKKFKMSTKLYDIIIKNERKEVLSIEDIKESFDQQLKDLGLYEQAKEINEIYKDIKVEMKYETQTNKDIIQKSRLLSENNGIIKGNGNIEITNIHMQQIFNNSSLEDGGRRYNAYQNCPKQIRDTFIINGEETIQLDMQASQINMLYHLENQVCPYIDPYDIFENDPKRDSYHPEFLKAMRKITKQSILIMLNSKNYSSALGAIKADDKVIENLLIVKKLKPGNNNEDRFKDLSENEINVVCDTESTENDNIIPFNTIEYNQHMNDIICWEKMQQDNININENENEMSEYSLAYTSDLLYPKSDTLPTIIKIIKENHSNISSYFHSGYGVKLQRKESTVVSNTIVEIGKKHNTCVLGVHDEIIVPISKAIVAHDIFIKNYKQEFNGNSCVLTDSSNKDFKTSNLYLSQGQPLPFEEELSKPVPPVEPQKNNNIDFIDNILPFEEELSKPVPPIEIQANNSNIDYILPFKSAEHIINNNNNLETNTEINECLNEIGRKNNILIDSSAPINTTVKVPPFKTSNETAQNKFMGSLKNKTYTKKVKSQEQIELETYVSVFD